MRLRQSTLAVASTWAWALVLVGTLSAGDALGQAAPAPASAPAPVPAPAPAPANPHAQPEQDPLADSITADAKLPRGSIAAQIVNETNTPVAGVAVRLAIHFESIAEGQDDKEQTAKADADGQARFNGLAHGSNFNYRIIVDYAGAAYSSEAFNLGPEVGYQVRLHVFPSTSDASKTRVSTRALYSIEPRDEVFQVQALIRLSNHGPLTFKPEGYEISFPEGAKAFTDDSKLPQRFESSPKGAKLVGSFAPYRHHDLRFRFQVPNTNEERQAFSIGLLPGAIESRVIIERGRGMQLDVKGYGEIKEDTSPDGREIIWAQNIATRDGEARDAQVVLSGLPTTGPVRLWVVAAALLMALLGVHAARKDKKSEGNQGRPDFASDLLAAQNVLLEELQSLERAKQTDAIGPKTYERARAALIAALVQLRHQLAERKS